MRRGRDLAVAIRKRGKRWVVDTYFAGRRRWRTVGTRREAGDLEARLRTEAKPASFVCEIPDVTLREFVPVFLGRAAARGARPATLVRYEGALGHVLATDLADVKIRDLTRPAVERWLEAKLLPDGGVVSLGQGIGGRQVKRSTARVLLLVLSALMSAAVSRQVIAANPLRGLGKDMRLGGKRDRTAGRVKAFDAAELGRFLEAAWSVCPSDAWAFSAMAAAGLRVGETLGLRWARHVDLEEAVVHVREQVLGPLKDGEGRDVPLSPGLRRVLASLQARQLEEAFAAGRAQQEHLFREFDAAADAKTQQRVTKRLQRGFRRALVLAGLPTHHTMHSLRHTFASLLLARGTPIAAVREWLGHATIGLTVDLYGSWLPSEARLPDLISREVS